jgi:GT2 family glycosyltransferase
VWLHDEDDFPEPHCLEKLLALPAGKIRAPRVMDPQSGKDLLYFKRMRGPLGYFYTAPDKSKVVSTAGTAGLMIHREIIDRIGVYDPRFFVGFEDYDYCLRAGRAGYPVTVVDEAVVYHPDHQSQLSARAGILECVLTHLPSFWGIIRMGSGRDFYTVRNYILLSKRHKSKVIVTLEMLVSLMLLPMFKLADHRVELRTTLKTYLKTLCAG